MSLIFAKSQDAKKAYELVRSLQTRFVEKLNDLSEKYGENKKFEEVIWLAVWPNEKGEKITPSKLKSKIQIVNFWASWCLPCLEEMPSLLNLKKKYGDDKLQVVAVNTDDEDQMKKLMKTMKKLGVKNEFVHILDSQSKISDTFGITAIPVTMVFSNGKLLEYNNGPVDFQSGEFVAKVEKWLK